jgi:hypothetical protein
LFLIAFMLLGGPILRLVYGPYYKNAAMVLVLLSAGKLAAVWAGSCGAVLQSTSHQTSMLRINLLTSPEQRGETIENLPGRTPLESVGPPGVVGPPGAL